MSHPRRTHRRRTSALHLSSDTTASLPEYIPWHNPTSVPSDLPPDYPDSAEEADEDTDTDSNALYTFPPPSASNSPRLHGYTSSPSPRKPKRFVPTHKRKHSLQVQQQQQQPSDPYLDALLARSVHALEMSNTLLQSSISTQTSLSAVLACDSPSDTTLETRAMNLSLSSRIRDGWSEDLDEITRDVDILFPQDVEESGSTSPRRQRVGSGHGLEGSLSCSLPSSSSPVLKKNSRRPSLDLRLASEEATATPRLNYSAQHRANLIAPPPRALTQYITDADNAFPLPSTLGLRLPEAQHGHTPEWKPLSEFASSSMTSLSLPPKLTDKPLEPSTPAYAMLSSFMYRAPSSASSATGTPSSSFTSSFIVNRRLDSSNTGPTKERNNAKRRSSRSPVSRKSPDKMQQHQYHQERSSRKSSASQTPIGSPLLSALHRSMTPPVEESSSSSDGVVAKQTVKSLRKILDDQPEPPPLASRSSSINRLKAPAFMPRTPAPVAEAGTSTATASVSRLFTKGIHSSSTRAPPPPLQSAMKRSASESASPSTSTPGSATHSKANSLSLNTSPTVLSIPDMVSKVLGGGTPSSSSGTSTPSKRISFAQLPEAYGTSSSKFKEKQELSRRKRANRKDSSKGKGRVLGEGGSSKKDQLGPHQAKPQGWWNGWLAMDSSNLHGLNMSLARQQERMEDRTTRSWGGRMGAGFGSGLDEWAV